ncbi:solute carrier organic anion transporter family member 4A1-like [Nematostella vectensis]|uniref:solute carrier organic anion transporter family member 4A1-like n=1 Tax=Nematostella vectensis TaxID=45351 RepID=UPI00207763BA|nr:solute carrier organic anion transporter family member 4A1-like [Nematostella vectensis]
MGKNKEQVSGLLNESTATKNDANKTAWGWMRFKPSWLQWLNSPKWFLFFLCTFSFLQGMGVNTLVSVALPTLERRFSLTSQMSGFIMSSNDITALIVVVFVSFFGSYGHKTKWLGGGAIITGLSCLLFTLPKFIAEKHDPTGARSGISPYCIPNATLPDDPRCHKDASSFNLYYFIFILSQLLSGAATTPLHTLGPAWLDENVPPTRTATYLAIFYMSVFLGPGLGSLIGGKLLTVYVDVEMPPGLNLTPAHPYWIGAWWLGPFHCGFLLIICGIILLGFPRHLPGAEINRENAIKSGQLRKQDNKLKGGIKDILPATKALLTNGTYVFQNLGSTASTMVGFGIGPFLYKFLSGRYGASPFYAGLGIALLLIPGAAAGLGLGTLIVNKLGVRRSCRRAAKVTFLLQLVGIWGSLNFLIPGCTYAKFAGVDVPYHNSSSVSHSDGIPVPSSCNSHCSCSNTQFRPVCGPAGVNYFSPCHAGCPLQRSRNQPRQSQMFTNCTCVTPVINNISSPTSPFTSQSASPGLCPQDCPTYALLIFCVSCFFVVILGFSNAIPSKIVSLRSVPDNLRAYGLGIQFVFKRTLGALPGPVIIGTIIDHTCTLWKTKCGKPANCLNYDYNRLGWIITVYAFPPQCLCLLFYFLSFYLSKDVDPDATLSKSHAADEVLDGKKPILGNDENSNQIHDFDEEGHTIV